MKLQGARPEDLPGASAPRRPISRPRFCGRRSPIDEWDRSGPRRGPTTWSTWPPNHSWRFPVGLLLLAAGIIAATACDINVGPAHVVSGSGSVKTESRTVTGFDRVNLAGTGSLVMTQGDTDALRITADDNLLPLLRSDVVGGTLQLAPKDNTAIQPSTTIRYELTFKQLHGVSLEGTGDMRSDAVSTDQLVLRLAGSGSARIVKLTADALTVTVAGSGDVDVAGTVSNQTVNITGSGTYRASDLATKQAVVNVSGSGDCQLKVSENLTAHVMGSGSIKYSGSPVVNEQVLGSGSITHTG